MRKKVNFGSLSNQKKVNDDLILPLSIDINASDGVIIFGMTQSGKSYFAKWLIRKMRAYIVYDTLKQHRELGTVVFKPESITRLWEKGVRKIVYSPSNILDTNEFNSVCKTILELRSPLMFMIEEIEDYADPYSIPSYFASIIAYGRASGDKRYIGFMGIVQTPTQMHKLVRSQAKHIFSFYMHEPDHIKIMRKWIGEKAQVLPKLKAHQGLYYAVAKRGETRILDPVTL